MLNRRTFLKTSSLISLAPTVPMFLSRLALATESAADNGRRLVVIQLDGGNDGINSVVPFRDEGYAKHRRELRLPESELLKVSDEFAFHSRFRSLSQLFEEGRLSIAHGVGYPNPNRSHFESMKIWHVGGNQPELLSVGNGWLGDAFGSAPVTTGKPQAIHVGDDSLPLALIGRRCMATTVSDPADLQLRASISKPNRSISPTGDGSLADFVSKSVSEAYASAEQLSQATAKDASARYPENRLGQKLKLVSQLIKADAGARVYYTSQSGYDTHAGQLSEHGDLLGQLSSSLKAFMDDMQLSGLEDQILVMCFSEFGRRVEENDSFGTDHGTAGPVFLAGTHLAERSYGQLPSLTDLEDGDLKFHLDFRQLYAAIVTDWLAQELPQSLHGFRMDRLLKS